MVNCYLTKVSRGKNSFFQQMVQGQFNFHIKKKKRIWTPYLTPHIKINSK